MNQEQKNILKAIESTRPFLNLSDQIVHAYNELIARYHAIAKEEQSKSNPIDKVNVGDIFVCSWGHGQTNIEYYQVTRKTKKTIALRALALKVDLRAEHYNVVSPNVDVYSRETITRRKVQEFDGDICISIGSLGKSAMLWNGKARRQTASGYGH